MDGPDITAPLAQPDTMAATPDWWRQSCQGSSGAIATRYPKIANQVA